MIPAFVRILLTGPDETTDSMLELVEKAIFPKIEKVTTPAIRHVTVFTMQVIIASLLKEVNEYAIWIFLPPALFSGN